MERPSWDEYYTEITKKVAERSTCDRGHAACVIVKENRILAYRFYRPCTWQKDNNTIYIVAHVLRSFAWPFTGLT